MKKKKFDFDYPVSRRTLAQYCFPSPTVCSSVRRLRRWICDDAAFRQDLEAVGCHPRQRWFNRKQVEVFRKYFG